MIKYKYIDEPGKGNREALSGKRLYRRENACIFVEKGSV